MGVALILGVAAAILSFIDIGGEAIRRMAQEALRAQTGLELSAAGVRGNPVRGYTFEEVRLASGKGDPILSARSLSGAISFSSLLGGSPRLSSLAVGGIDMNLDQFITEIQRIELPSGGGGAGIPIDRISLLSCRFTSRWGTVEVQEIGANLQGGNMKVDAAGAVNGVPVRGTADLDLQGRAVSVNKADIGFGRGSIAATGDIRPHADGTTALNLQGSVRGLNLQELTALWPSFLRKENYNGTVNLDLEARGTSAAPVLSGTVDYRGTALGGYPVERLGARLRYADQRLTVSDIEAVVLSVPIDGELALATRPGQPPSVMIKLEGRDAPLDDIGKTFPSLAGIEGRVSAFTANIQGPTNALSGVVNLSAPRVAFRGKELSNLALQLKVTKSDTAAVNGKFFFEGAQGYLQGTIGSLLTEARPDLTAKLVALDVKRVSDLIPDIEKYGLSGKINATVGIRGNLSAPELSGTLQSPSLTVQGCTLTQPSVSFAYAGDVLTLQKSGGTLNGMPIQVSGTVRNLTSKTPAIDMRAQLTVAPDALKAYVPDIAGYGLKGEIRAGVRLSGKLPAPEIYLVASSPALSALDQLTVKNLEVSTALGGDLSKLDRLSLAVKADIVAANGLSLSALTAAIQKEGSKLTLSSLSARSGAGKLSGAGTASPVGQGQNPKLDLVLDLDRLELAPLAATSGLDLKGALSGKLQFGGTVNTPELSFKGQSPSISVQGTPLSNLTADLSGTPQALKVNVFKADIGGAPLSASGTIRLSPSLRADLAIRGEGLDLAALTEGYPDLRGQLKGRANLAFDLSGTDKGGTGTGTLSAASVEAFGLKLTSVTLPLSLNGDAFTSSNGALSLYGGKAANSLTFNLKSLKFSDTLTVSGVDLNALAQDATGGFGGKVTGQASLSLKITGSAGKTKTAGYAGTGQFTLGPGGISGFKGLDLVTRLYGVNAIRYTQVTAPLEIRTGRLILKKGAMATAPEGDPLYRYARLAEDGAITFDKTLYLVAEGNVNFQLVNALAGGALGGAGALLQGGAGQLMSGPGLEGLLKGALQGGKQGGGSADFRDVTVKVTGKTDSPSVSLVKVGPSARPNREEPSPAASPGTTAVETPQKSIEEKAIDRLVEVVAPKKPEAPQAQQDGASGEAPPQEQSPAQPSFEDRVRERVEDELKKGLEKLFK